LLGSDSELVKAKKAERIHIDQAKTPKREPVATANTLPASSTNLVTKSTKKPTANPDLSEKTALNTALLLPSQKLNVGSNGEDVLALEKTLSALRYDVGAVDGFYDRQTWQGVVAFQKYAKLKRTGTYTVETYEALKKATIPEGSYPKLGMPRIEIDLRRQILFYYDAEGLNRVIAVSTGSNRKYCELSKKSGKQVCGLARTPRGRFRIQRKIPGWRESDLGKLYNPLYFSGGFAIHGSASVPASNVSHGCVRISIETSLWFFDAVKIGTPVIVDG
jgi:peptidoglycan hydrolase-like protein with peptidoglycan-binding domain